ncbi:carbohydrate porin [Orenia marismortui]|uniref:carbohydrate porin n=1 Tax=Orenia marismortui TaxID=46469 RepID=UPI00036607B4|nr:carbohydrate porin [Orenia marismortui]
MKKRFSLFLTVALMVALVALPAFAKTSVRPGEDGKVEVTFTYAGNPDANAVYVAGEFNNWLPNFPTYKMKKENGVWTLTTQLEKGKYQYKFTVYGGGMLQWIKDDQAASFAADGFGGQNSVVIADPNAGLASRVIALEKQMAVTNIGFNYSGYARAGVLLSGEGGALDSHMGLFADYYSRWRLGNENDTYVEQTFSKKFTGDNGSWMKANILLANKKLDYQTYGNDAGQKSTLRQAYVEGGGFDVAPDVNFWVGERYYGRDDIHITDNRWRELDAFGAGAQGIKLGATTLDAAFLVRGTDDGLNAQPDLGEKVQKNIDLRFKDIVVPGGNLEVEARYAWQTDVPNGNDVTGYELDFIYSRTDFYGFADGFSKAIVQYGDSIGADLGNAIGYTSEDASAMSFITYGLANINENWDIMPQFIYETYSDKYGVDNPEDETRMMIGARAVRYITNNFSMQFEYGFESYDQTNGWVEDQKLHKFTVAPTLKLSNSFWGRPELRVFATYASVNDNASLPEPYADDDSGMAYGVQAELWW